MDTDGILLQSPGTICICVDEYEKQKVLCRVYHAGNKYPLYLYEMGRLLIEIDRILDELHYPESSTAGRSFKRLALDRSKTKERVSMTKKVEIQQKGGKGTFVVQIQYRQHATWQGKVVWAEKDESRPFRSALELLKLIDSALDENEKEESAAFADNNRLDNEQVKGNTGNKWRETR